MTISTTINRKEYVGDGSSTSFSFPYFVIAAADLKVYQNGTLKTITTHYTLSGSAPYSSGTNVQFVSAPALNDEIVIIRDPAITQAVDLVDNDPLPAASIETPLDRLTMIAQRLGERIDRSFTLADTDVSGASTELPTPAANKLIGWDSAGTALANYASASIADTIVPTAFMETLLDDTSAATARTTLGAFASAGGTISGAVTVQGDVTLDTGKALIFEGAAADAFETTLGVTDPTADRTIALPNASGTVALTSDIAVTSVNGNTGAVKTITLSTPQATTSGTVKDFLSLPAGIRRITMTFSGVSTNGTANFLVQIGDSGGLETSGYVSGAGSTSANSTATDGFIITVSTTAGGVANGAVTLHLANATSFTWVLNGVLSVGGGGQLTWSGGTKSLSAELDRIRLTTVAAADTFDAGEINITYE